MHAPNFVFRIHTLHLSSCSSTPYLHYIILTLLTTFPLTFWIWSSYSITFLILPKYFGSLLWLIILYHLLYWDPSIFFDLFLTFLRFILTSYTYPSKPILFPFLLAPSSFTLFFVHIFHFPFLFYHALKNLQFTSLLFLWFLSQYIPRLWCIRARFRLNSLEEMKICIKYIENKWTYCHLFSLMREEIQGKHPLFYLFPLFISYHAVSRYSLPLYSQNFIP